MDSRERVFRALERKGPDRLPLFHQLLPGGHLKYGKRGAARVQALGPPTLPGMPRLQRSC